MRDLTITQEYLICAVNEKGKISGFSTEKLVCLVASGLLELQMENCVQIDKKKVTVTGTLPESRQYLRPLYDFINQAKPVKLEKVLEAYSYSFTDQRLKDLMDSIGRSLEGMGMMEISKGGLFGNKNCYIPTKEAIHYVIDMVRAEMLEEGEVTEDIAALVILLDASKTLRTYFSEFERKEIKAKLKEIVQSETGKTVKEMVAYVEDMISALAALVVVYS